jgi:hypothetical protein
MLDLLLRISRTFYNTFGNDNEIYTEKLLRTDNQALLSLATLMEPGMATLMELL